MTEVILVVVILGVMAGYAIPQYQNAYLKAVEKRHTAMAVAIYGASQIYYSKHGNQYPDLWGAYNMADVNSTLGLNLSMEGIYYFGYWSPSPLHDRFSAEIKYGNTGDPGYFNICITQHPLGNTDPNPCCVSGYCPTLPACDVSHICDC